MQNLMKFQGHKVEMLELNGIVYFNPYDVGCCLGLCDSSVRMAMSKMSNKQAVIIKNSDVNKVDTRKLNNAGEKFLTESGVYKLIFKSNKPNAEKFADWVTDTVLPSIRKTGSYSVNPTPKDPEEYTPKYYRGEPVVTVHDIEAKSNVADYTIRYHLRKLIRNVDYYLLEGAELAEFKRQNPSVDKMYSSLLVINRKGFGKLVKLMRSFSTLGSFKHALPAPEPKEGKIKYVNLLDNNEMHARIVNMNRKAHTVLELLEQLMRKNDEDSHLSICKTLEVLTRRMSVDWDFSYIKYDLIER